MEDHTDYAHANPNRERKVVQEQSNLAFQLHNLLAPHMVVSRLRRTMHLKTTTCLTTRKVIVNGHTFDGFALYVAAHTVSPFWLNELRA